MENEKKVEAGVFEHRKIKGLYCTSRAKIASGLKVTPPVRFYGRVTTEENVRVGKYTYIGNRTKIGPETKIGSYCSISRDIEIGPAEHPLDTLSTHPFQYNEKHFPLEEYKKHQRIEINLEKDRPTLIGNDVWIGAKSLIVRGVSVGDGAVIGGGAVVTKDVPPYAIVAGVPAMVVRHRFEPEIIERLVSLKWWEMDPLDMDGVNYADVLSAVMEIEKIKFKLIEENRNEIKGVVKNNGGGSKKGILWLKTKYGRVDRDRFQIGQSLEVVDVKEKMEFKGVEGSLPVGIYELSRAEYDESRGWYRLEIKNALGVIYKGAVGKNDVSFRLL